MTNTTTNGTAGEQIDAVMRYYHDGGGENGQPCDPENCSCDVKDTKAQLLALIEQEKQELIARVEHEVIGANINWSHSERMQYSTRETDALDYMFAVNGTKDEAREALNKLKDSETGE